MKKKKVIIFDLDGTLTDPKIGITKSVQYALAAEGVDEPDLDALVKFIGPPLLDSFQSFYGFEVEQATRAIEQYRVYFSKKGLYENEVYDGIPELLQYLQEAGKRLAVASSKPTVFVDEILKHFRLDGFFELTAGSNLDNTRRHKNEVIEFVLSQMEVTDLQSAVMIGDKAQDVVGAKKVGIDSIGVSYGYGSIAELQDAQANAVSNSVTELQQILI